MALCTVCHENEATIEAEEDCPETMCSDCNSPCEVCGSKQCYRCDVPCDSCSMSLCNAHRTTASVIIDGEEYDDPDHSYCKDCVVDAIENLREDVLQRRADASE